jgi:hypothetical protein
MFLFTNFFQSFGQTCPDRVRLGGGGFRRSLRRPEGDQRRSLGDRKETQVDLVRRTFDLQDRKDHRQHRDGLQRHGTRLSSPHQASPKSRPRVQALLRFRNSHSSIGEKGF